MRWLKVGLVLTLASACGEREDESTPPAASAAAFDIERDEFTLAADLQRYVWDIERYVHYLQMEVAPRLIDGLAQGDASSWRRYAANDFRATVPAGDRETIAHGPVTIERWRACGAARRVDVDAFFQYLVARGKPVEEGPALVAVHVDDLAPETPGAFDGPWRGTWTILLRASDEQTEYKAKADVSYARLTTDPARDTGWLQALAITFEERRRTPEPLMQDVTAKSGLDLEPLYDAWRDGGGHATFPLHFLDYDRDGRLDVLFFDAARPGHPTVYLYRGLGNGEFRDVTLEARLLAPPSGTFAMATVADLDNDGYEDLVFDIAPVDRERPLAYRNNGDGRFERVKVALPRLRFGNAAVADYDNDGLVDLYLPNAGPPVPDRKKRARWIGDRTGSPGVLLRNRGGFRFENVTEQANASGGNREVFAAAWADLEPDGDADLLLANHMGENAVLENRGDGTFRELPFARTFGGFSMGLATGDLDNDGRPDAFVANMSSRAGKRIFHNLGAEDFPPGVYELMYGWIDGNEILRNTYGDAEPFEVVGLDSAGWAYGPALVDLDGDGRLDVYCPTGYQSITLDEPDG